MTRARIYGSDEPFLAWLRAQKDLPSYSTTVGFVAADVDVAVHRYLSAVDGIGTREAQGMMRLEVKTRGGGVNDSQRDTFFKDDLFYRKAKTVEWNGQTIRHFGISFVMMDGDKPDNSEVMYWGRFKDGTPIINFREITLDQLMALLRFEIHPDTFEPRPFRRHHKTREVLVERSDGLFPYDERIVERS